MRLNGSPKMVIVFYEDFCSFPSHEQLLHNFEGAQCSHKIIIIRKTMDGIVEDKITYEDF